MLESGALSEPAFAEFAKNVVPYLHVTTRIEGVPYDGLLKEKGGRGFPTLMFLDAEGGILAQQNDRSVAGFRSTLGKVQEYLGLQARAAAGETGLEVALLKSEMALGRLKFEEARQRIAALPQLGAADRAALEARLFALEVHEIIDGYQPGKENPRVQKLVDAAMAGTAPQDPEAQMQFWGFLAYYANENKNADLLEKCIAGLRALPEAKEYEDYLKNLEKRLANLRGAQNAG